MNYLKVLVLKEEHEYRYFNLPLDEKGKLNEEETDKLILAIVNDRCKQNCYWTKKEKLPVEPTKPEQKEKYILDAYNDQLRIYKQKRERVEQHNEEVELLEKAKKGDAMAAWQLLQKHNTNQYEYEGYEIITVFPHYVPAN